jgi:hypothetical protein
MVILEAEGLDAEASFPLKARQTEDARNQSFV